MLNKNIAMLTISAAVGISAVAVADGYKTFNFKPLDESANAADWYQTALFC